MPTCLKHFLLQGSVLALWLWLVILPATNTNVESAKPFYQSRKLQSILLPFRVGLVSKYFGDSQN